MTKRQFALLTLPAMLALAAWPNLPTSRTVPPIAATEEAPAQVLRSRIDLARGIRWDLHWGSVSAHDVATDRPIRSLPLPGATLSGSADSCIPDMVLDRMGALVVSSNITTRMWRVSPARFEIEVYDIETDSHEERDFGFTALGRGLGMKDLYAANSAIGATWHVDLESGKATRVAQGVPMTGACAG